MLPYEEEKHTLESRKSKTDHILTIIQYKLKKNNKTTHTKTVRTINKQKWNEYRRKLEEEIQKNEDNIKSNYEIMEKCIKTAGNQIMKLEKIKIKKNIPMIGYNNEIKKKIKERRSLYTQFNKEEENDKKQELKENYIAKKKEIINDIFENTTQGNRNNDYKKKNDGKTDFSKIIKDIKCKPEKKEEIKTDEGRVTNDTNEIIELKKIYYKNLYKEIEMNEEEKK